MRPRKPTPVELQLQREIDTLSIKLLRANSALRLKTLYCERLEYLVHERNEHIDALNAKLEHAHTINRRLEAECEHLAGIIANDHRPQTRINGGLEAP